jgi:hypothetical protein
MNDRPTPETDQFKVKFKTVCGEKYWVPLELSERLELELNEARDIGEKLSKQGLDMMDENRSLKRERDEAREAAERWESSSDAMERAGAEQARRADENREWALKAERERDEAWKELEEYRSIAENIGAVKAVSEKEKAICERDEAWEKLKPLRQSLLDSQDEVLRLTFENRKISQELDEARDTIMKIEEIFIDSEDMHDDWMKVGNIARTFCEK